jgi:hypothetical protein
LLVKAIWSHNGTASRQFSLVDIVAAQSAIPTLIMTIRISLLLATLAVSVLAGTNPDSQGACDPPQGGANACGPNGSEEWLNTGLTDSNGWNPPFLDINDLVHISLEEYYAGVGAPCQLYDDAFQASGSKYGVDPAILAFIAMQESSCDANAGGPTPGLSMSPCLAVRIQNSADAPYLT